MGSFVTPSPRHPVTPSLVIGLVGGIGSGKSLVARTIVQHGGEVIDADKIGHEALRDPAIKELVIARWGPATLDESGEVHRRSLGKIVFADAAELATLEGWVLPYISRRIAEQIAAARTKPGVAWIVLDAPTMLETGWDKVCDLILYIDAPREQRLARVQARNGWADDDLARREARQLSLDAKKRRADAILDNSTTPEDAARQVEILLKRWRSEGASR